jgi:cyclopropane-fatty-acyl-phospholipid synthase
MTAVALGIAAIERGLVPDTMTRAGIRRLCRTRLSELADSSFAARTAEFLAAMRSGPIAPLPEKANEQHYELPPEFFTLVLGPRRKYSCCHWSPDTTSLAAAEDEALAITAQRAELRDGQEILELGCGWGSLSLWMAERFPTSRITAVSNSAPQRRFIEGVAAERGLTNLRIVTADMNDFTIDAGRFDRVVSIEMFEHMRNYERLLARIAGWLRPEGKLFIHWFCHKQATYPFETAGDDDWMGKYFFSGGLMPCEDLLSRFTRDLTTTRSWRWSGTHYRRTADAWLANLDAQRVEALEILAGVYGRDEARRWFHRWRVFFLAVSELFGYAGGDEWFVSHRLLERTARTP